jgi:hypothetical protein
MNRSVEAKSASRTVTMELPHYPPQPASASRVKQYLSQRGNAIVLLLTLIGSVLPACTRQENSQVIGKDIPKLVDTIAPNSDWKSWLDFFQANESTLVYLELGLILPPNRKRA